jgi:tRNA U34 5-carboxymethylaminomethyl modifying GTPase MnmE/TrmE
MNKAVGDGMADVEVAILVVEAVTAFKREDGTLPPAELELIKELKKRKLKGILVINKIDLLQDKEKLLGIITNYCKHFDFEAVIPLSAKTGDGLDALYSAVSRVSKAETLSPDSAVLISERQRDLARRAFLAVSESLSAMDSGVTPDAVGVLVDEAIAALYELTGKRVTDAVTDEIFRKFCVGK